MKNIVIVRNAKKNDAIAFSQLNKLFNDIEICPDVIVRKLDSTGEIVLISELNGSVVGFGCAQIYQTICSDYDIMEITELFIQKDSRRMGIASLILKKFEEIAYKHGICEIKLVTGQKNQTAQKLYQKNGFLIKNRYLFEKTIC